MHAVTHTIREPAAVGIYTSDDADPIDIRGDIDIADTTCGVFGQAFQTVRAATGHSECMPTDQNFYA